MLLFVVQLLLGVSSPVECLGDGVAGMLLSELCQARALLQHRFLVDVWLSDDVALLEHTLGKFTRIHRLLSLLQSL